MIKKALAVCVVACAFTAFGSQPKLEIYKGESRTDTVFSSSFTLVAITDPGATATVNGISAKVYPTGSFGSKVDLAPGNNEIVIEVSKDGESASKTVNVFKAEKPEKPAKQTTPASEKIFTAPFTVFTTKGAYLQYAESNDRLGGSKMGFLVADIPLKVIAESGDLYKVQLSATRFAFIPKEYTQPCDQNLSPTVNTGSWSVTEDGNSDYVSVSLPRKLPYYYYTGIDPNTIVVELYGACDNSNWITQRTLDLGIIDYVNFNQVESDVYQVIIHLKKKYQWGFSVSYNGNALKIRVRHQPKNLDLKYLTIGLDAGHGGQYPGAISFSGIKEKDVNLDIVLHLKALLEKAGAKVVLTRSDDTGPSMAERKRIWTEADVDLAISVHNNAGCNAFDSPGTSTYYKHLFCRPLAKSILGRLLETGLPMFGLVGNFNFSLNGPTDFPNTLVEGMFMSSLQEEAKLADPQFRQLFAQKIFLGLQDYLKSAK